jgi:predicted amidohydrolase YtcJ
MLADYLPEQTGGPAHRGRLLLDVEALNGIVTELDRLGFGIVIHVAGDRAVRVALDAIAQARERNGAGGPRHQLAHAGFIDPQDLPRFAALDVTADQSPYLWYPSPIIDSIIGALGERGRHYWPVKSLLDAGAHVVAGSDWPAVLPDMNPWIGIEALVSRAHPRAQYPGSFWPEQAVSLEQALRIMTLNGAVALALEKITGSIEAGKSADLIILKHNLFEIPVAEVSETQVHTTYFEGRVVYSGAAAERPAP